MAVQLNPEVVKPIIKDIIKQVEYHHAKAKNLPKAIKGLKSIKGAKSWGDLASKASNASKGLRGTKTFDVLPHIKTRYKFYNDPATSAKSLKPEFVTAPIAAKVLGGAGALAGLAGGAAALGAGAIGYNWWKHNKEINEWTKQNIKNYDFLIEAIRNRRK